MIQSFLRQSIWEFTQSDGSLYNLTLGNLLGCFFALVVIVALLRLSLILLASYSQRHEIEESLIKKIKNWIYAGYFISWIILCLLSLNLNWIIWKTVTVQNVLLAILLVVLAKLADWIISARILEEIDSKTFREIYKTQYGSKNRSNITSVVQYAMMIILAILLIRNFGLDDSIGHLTLQDQSISITISKLLVAVLILLITRLLIWIIVNIFLYSWYKREKIDLGKQYAYNQLLSYVIYFFASIIAVQMIGIDLTLLWAGAAFLLVGVGIALQQVFSDFFSGLVILSEGSVEVGDFLDFGSFRGTVKKIGLRASIVESTEQKDMVIPNSKLVNETVINWSSTKPTTRFMVAVGVAYGSDTQLVKKLLLQAATENSDILVTPAPFVRFESFGDSSLDFVLYFFSNKVVIIEDIRSDLRFRIEELFTSSGFNIPFPQREIWVNEKKE